MRLSKNTRIIPINLHRLFRAKTDAEFAGLFQQATGIDIAAACADEQARLEYAAAPISQDEFEAFLRKDGRL